MNKNKKESDKKIMLSVRGVLKRVFGVSKKNEKSNKSANNVSKSNTSNNAASSLTNVSSSSHHSSSSSFLSQSDPNEDWPSEGKQGDQNPEKTAVFQKVLSFTKGKPATETLDETDTNHLLEEIDLEFESKKQEWQEELDQMSEFLVLKSTEQQRHEGILEPVDTAYIDDKNGMPVLKACFDIKHFKPDEVQLNVEDGYLTLFAQCLEEKEVALYKKTMIRKMQLPRHADSTSMQCELSQDQKVLIVEMPFHLPSQKKPHGPSVVPIVCDEGGRKKIRLTFPVGPDFVEDDLTVSLDERKKCLTVEASYEAALGLNASQVTKRQFRKKFQMPDFINVEKVEHSLSSEGKLFVDVLLLNTVNFHTQVITEEVSVSDGQSDDKKSKKRDEFKVDEVDDERDLSKIAENVHQEINQTVNPSQLVTEL